MTTKSRGVRGSVFQNQGTVDAQLWKSLQDALFLESAHSLSRVEAYPADLLVPAGDETTPAGKAQNTKVTDIAHAAPPVVTLSGDDADADEFEIPQFTALRTPKDITDHINKTRRFRAFFVRQRYSWGPLLITSHLFAQLMLRARISSRLKSFILYFGGREREIEVSPPGLRFIRLSPDQQKNPDGHECMYGLRFMERNGRTDEDKPSRQWSLRQSALYCRYAPAEDGVSWLFITISQLMQQRLIAFMAESESLDDSDPFEIHFLLIGSAISSWRQYLIDLSAETDAQYAQLLGTSPSDEGPIDLHESDRRQELLILDEKLLNALLAIKATADTLSAMTSAWETSAELSQTPMAYDELIRSSFSDQKRDLQLITSQIENLRSKLAGVTNLLSSFLDLSSGFSLQNLVKESGKENEEMRKLSERMHRLAEKSTQDAAAVKVLTILTLTYLPVTVVSNFFSTSFVNTQIAKDGSGSIIVYGDWWILLAVSIPLTLITIYVWLVWTHIQASTSTHPWWWYVLGLPLFIRRPKPINHEVAEKLGHDVNGTIVYSEPMLEEHPSRVVQRTSSDLC